MVEMLARAIERAGSTESLAVARALSGMSYGPADGNPLGAVTMRATDHQLIGPLVVSVMQRSGAPGGAVRRRGQRLRLPPGAGRPSRGERPRDDLPHGLAVVLTPGPGAARPGLAAGSKRL